MLRFLALGVGFGAGFQAWRNVPPDGPVAADSAVVVTVLAILAAYLGGRWHGRGRGASATATAVASADAAASAQSAVQVNLYTGPASVDGRSFSGAPLAGAASVGTRVPDESVSWFGGERAALHVDDLDGMELTELAGYEDPL